MNYQLIEDEGGDFGYAKTCITTRKEGPFPHQNNTKLTLKCDLY